jgi:hypothetical protein
MRRPLAVALAALALLAGCNAPLGTGTPPADGTDGAVTPGSVPAEVERPPGVGPDGVADAGRLADAHAAALSGRSLTVEKRHVQRFVDGGERAASSWVVRIGPDRKRYNATYRQSGAASSLLGAREGGVTRYANGSVVAQRRFGAGADRQGPDRVRLNRLANGAPAPPGAVVHGRPVADRRLEALFATAWRANVTELGNGHVRVTATRPPETYRSPAGRVVEIDRWRLVATVTVDGLVRSVRLEYGGRLARGDRRVTGLWTLRYSGVGSTTPEQPDWFDRAD